MIFDIYTINKFMAYKFVQQRLKILPRWRKEHHNQVSDHHLIGQIFGGVGSLASLG